MESPKSTFSIFPGSVEGQELAITCFLMKSKREKMNLIPPSELNKDGKIFPFLPQTDIRFHDLQNFKVSLYV